MARRSLPSVWCGKIQPVKRGVEVGKHDLLDEGFRARLRIWIFARWRRSVGRVNGFTGAIALTRTAWSHFSIQI